MTVRLSLLNDLKHLLGTADKPFSGPLHVDNLIFVLMYS